MKQTIFGEWTSQDGAGDMYRYIFNENGTYTYATRSGDEAWHTDHQGQFLYENQLLSLQYADGKWYNIGYVGIEGDEMVEGFKRVSGSTGLEGDWMLDASSRSLSFLFCPPQETSATPSISNAAQRAILPMTSVEI